MGVAVISERDAAKLNLKKIKGKCTCEQSCFSYVGMHTNKKCQCKVHRKRKKNTSGFVSKPTSIDGNWFASKAEARRYRDLKMELLHGDITDLELQPRYEIRIKGKDGEDHLICRYTADFRYKRDGRSVVEDVKSKRRDKHGKVHGTATARDWPLRKKLMKAVHDIDVVEVYY